MPDYNRAARKQPFWKQYSNALVKQGIKPDFVRWHVLRATAAVTRAEFSERLGNTRFAQLIRAHLDLFANAAAVIRARNLAFRTEQTYLNWMCRFMIHYGGCSTD